LCFYDQVGVLLRRGLIEFDLVDDLLGNSALQLWEKVAPMISETRERYDPRLYEHFEFLYDVSHTARWSTSRRGVRHLRVSDTSSATKCARHDSNMRPLPPQGSALSPELRAPGRPV
jgi:hypothetical protein